MEKIKESARAFSESIPEEVKQAANDVVEGMFLFFSAYFIFELKIKSAD